VVKVERLDVVPGVAECFSKVLCHKQFHLFILPIMDKEPPFQLFIKLEMSGRELSFVSRNSFTTVKSDKHMLVQNVGEDIVAVIGGMMEELVDCG